MNAIDIVLIVAIVGVLGFAVWRIVRNRKQGKSACGCDCGQCNCGCVQRKDGG